MCTLQRVKKLLKKVNTSIRTYVICLILSSGRKNCTDMARAIGISKKELYAYHAKAEIHSGYIGKLLLAYAKKTRIKGVKRALVIDATLLLKRFAQAMEKLCYDRDGCTRHVEHGLVPLYASVVDENVTIPLDLEFWVQKKIVGEKRYQSKTQIALALIGYLKKSGLEFDFVSLDGAFPGPDSFAFFKKTRRKFIMRISKAWCITTLDGERVQLRNCLELKLMRNIREKTIKAKLYGNVYFFTAQKRKTKSGEWETIFLVSNMNLSAKEQVAAYALRWPQEKVNRTTKQKFGAAQCQMLPTKKQRAHIMATFLAYAIIEIANNDKEKLSVDETVNFLRRNHFSDLVNLIESVKKSKIKRNIDLADKKIQNHVQNSSNNVVQFRGLYA